MFCKNCGQKLEGNQNFCTKCGTSFSKDAGEKIKVVSGKESVFTSSPPPSPKNSWSAGGIITILVILAVIGFGIYGNLDEGSITKNNEALTSFDSGDSQAAINQFQQAAQDATTNETKINVIKNLGYVHATEGQYEEALTSFGEALGLVKQDSFDHYLISGEIALLQFKPNAALLSFNKAYELSPTDFQINNSLALFYLDIEEIAPQYTDYPKALSYAKKARKYDVEKSEISKQNLAIAHFFNENFDQTISLLSTTNLSQHPYAAYWLGWAYVARGDETNAKSYFQKAVDAGIEMEQEAYDYLYSY
ncbi:tetratricopeptide repeat protein [Candidatus Parcubacteria bacterium]|nr:tetratricopeptide repeat protein [Candidatus Parcubacteria bacterium]